MRFRGAGKAGGGASCWGVGFRVIWEKGTGPRASREPRRGEAPVGTGASSVENTLALDASLFSPVPLDQRFSSRLSFGV